VVYFLSAPKQDSFGSISIDEFLDELPKAAELQGPDQYLHILDRLWRTRGEIEFIEKTIRDIFDEKPGHELKDGYGDSAIVLGKFGDFNVRAVKWPPMSMVSLPNMYRVGLAYDFAHNHDFQLITKGVFGPGYETDVHRCDAALLDGSIGETVDLEYQGRFKLNRGSVMWYEQYHDVHNQIAPQSFSLSLNVIPNKTDSSNPQLGFDVANGRISTFTRNGESRIVSLIGLLSEFSDTEETLELAYRTARAAENLWVKKSIAALISKKWSIEFREALGNIGVQLKQRKPEVTSDSFSMRNIA
tara:strand:- start:369 stop:1271 length:903 start_codon:yes stop_codon:yes gene_type:complete